MFSEKDNSHYWIRVPVAISINGYGSNFMSSYGTIDETAAGLDQ